ncbi:MAG: response regulator [Bdellovibrionaceae bacterium]|nr:response regulator [Pseudobdellovibrionaceae bacterium]
MKTINPVLNRCLKFVTSYSRVFTWWHNLSVTKKLYGIVGVMALLIASELLTLMFAMSTLSAVRAFVAGEGLWTKAQKDAIHCLYQYVITGDPRQYKDFKENLKINEGDHIALLELSKNDFKHEEVRRGFLMGGNHPKDIDGMIELLQRFHWISYLEKAITAWTNGDRLITELREAGEDLHQAIQKKRPQAQERALKRIAQINTALTQEEMNFSKALGAGSRWLEGVLLTILLLVVATIEGTGIYLTYRFSRNLSATLKELTATAEEVGKGNFSQMAQVRSEDELGQLSRAINKMAADLKTNAEKRRQTEEILRKSEERFRILVEAVNEYAIYMLDPSGIVTTWNTGAQNIKGYTAEEVLGKHFSIFYLPEDVEAGIPDLDLNVARVKGRYEHEGISLRKDGSRFVASLLVTALYDQSGQLTGFSKVTRDITERKEAELKLQRLNENLEQRFEHRTRELQEREAQLRIVTNALPVLIAQMNVNEECIFANEKFGYWVSFNRRKIIGHTLQEVLGIDRYLTMEPFIKRVLLGEVVSFERFETQQAKEAPNVVYNITLVPELDEFRQVTSFILLANNVTQYKEIEDELKRAKERADVASSTKSAFLANMSHEIRTPLGAILSFSELMLGQEMSAEERVRGAEVIKRNGFLLSNIINDILDLSKVEAGKLDIEKIAVHFDEVVNEIKSLLNLRATEKGIRLTVTADGAIPDVIYTDPLRLRQILLNIVGNAIKFTQQGSVDVKISMLSNSVATSKLRFLVRDTGKGIKPDHAKNLFVPFSQEDISTTRKYGGTGLGLALSKKLANSLGGDVVLLESTPDRGSTFSITIDPGDLRKVLFQNFSPQPVDLAPSVEQPPDFRHLKILLVDDSLDNQLIVTHLLKKTGVTLDTASNGQEGVEKASRNKYDLVLMDLQMPILDGYGAIQELKRNGYNKPVIALTAHAMKEERRRCLQSGFVDHISKPVDRQLLIKTIANHTHFNTGELSTSL